MGILIQLFLIAFAVGLASSKLSTTLPADIRLSSNEENKCSLECINGIANNGVEFADNTKYGYEFNAKTTIIPPTGSEEGISEMSIKGKAYVIGTKTCGAIFYLKRIEIIQGSKVYNNIELEGKPILFSYNNGKVGENICSSADDSDSSLNLKRAIVSAFQVSLVRNSQKEFIETDNQGACSTIYSSSSSDSHLTIVKEKDLTKCIGYDNINIFGLSSSESNMVYQDSPFSSAVQHAEVKIIDSTIISVTNLETFLYRPFGPIDTVTKIKVSMSLNLKKMSTIQTPNTNFLSKRRSIVFETSIPTIESVDINALVAAINLATTNLEPVVGISGADSFANLVALFKVAAKDDIFSAFQQINRENRFDDPKIVETIFIDALIAANSGGSIEAVAELIHSKKLSDSLTVSWFKNLGKAKNPTKEAVLLASSLLNDRPLKEGYIGVGSLLQSYFKDTQDYDSAEVRNILHNLGAPLQKAYSGTLSSNDENLIIASLIGFKNAQYINNELEDVIIKLIMDKNIKQRIRVATLVMMKVYAKNPKMEKACENIFTDVLEDSELRILAFKVFAINPSNYKASVIKNILDDKKCQLQIRTFLLSYLNNLQTTNDEGKLDQKSFYEGIKTIASKKMYSDILRYSQSSEYSQNFPLINSGVFLDTEVIYSQKSYLPRFTSASFKTLLFGRNLNIFDFQMRVENIEHMLEKLFGPNGNFAKSNNIAFDDVKNYVTQAVIYAKERGLNNVDSDLPSKQGYGDISEEDLNKTYIDIVLNIFENDIGWFSFEGLDTQITYQNIIDSIINNLQSSLPNDNNIELNVRKRIPIIDYNNKYATCSGLPVSLKFQATTAFKFDIATKFDENFLAHLENSHFSLKFIPSGSLTLNTQLTVDGYVVEVGQKIVSSLHTSSGFNFSLSIIDGHGFKMVYGLPLDEMDLISIEYGAYSTVQERGSLLNIEPLSTPGMKKYTYTKNFDKLSNATGLSFFVHYDLPWNGHLMESLQPFAGTSSISLKVLKTDKQLTEYVMKGTYDFKSPMLKFIKFKFFTPESNIKRGVKLLISYDTSINDTYVAKYEFRTPFSLVVLQSVLVNSDTQKTIEVEYLDGTKYVFNLGIKCEKVDKETNKYFPVFETEYSTDINTKPTRYPGLPNFDIEGYVLVKRNVNSNSTLPSKFTLQDMAVITPNNKHSLQGTWTFDDNKATGMANLTTYGVKFDMYGLISGEYPVYKMIGVLDVIKNKPSQERSLSNYDNEPDSKFVDLLHKIKPMNIYTSQEIHVKAPYLFISNNYVLWNDGHFELNGDFLIENNSLTMHGNIISNNLFNSTLNANMTILPSTDKSGIFVNGFSQHSFVYDPSYIGYGDIEFVQNKDKRSCYFKLNSEHLKTLGVFHFNTNYQITDESFNYNLNYDSVSGSVLNASVKTNDTNFYVNLNSSNSEYNSFVTVHGWLEKPNNYKFDTKLLWPGTKNLNYLNADGNLFLNGLNSHITGNVDCPSANLVNVHLSIDSIPNPEMKDGGVATIRCVAKEQVLLFEKMKYQLTLNNNEAHISGESVYEDSQNLMPINFTLEFKNYIDKGHNSGKELAYHIELEQSNNKLIYHKNLKVTNRMLEYRQLYKINDDEQNVTIDLNYNFINIWNWSYRLKSKITSPKVFHLLMYDEQDLLECISYIKLNNKSLNQRHTLKIFSYGDLNDSYEFKLFLSLEKSVLKLLYGQREIRGLWHHSLEPIKGGYLLKYKGDVWLDYMIDPSSISTLSLDAYYSLDNGISTVTDLKLYVPYFDNKNMSVISDIQVLKSWKNPFRFKLDLDIFVKKEQALQLLTNFTRNVENDGVLYSVDLQAKSDGMKLDYLVRDSIFISNDRWGTYLEAYFGDSDQIIPIQLHFELVPKGLNNKINIFNFTVINVNVSINIEDGALNTLTLVNYNDHPYSLKMSLKPNPSFNCIMGWTDKKGIPKELMIEGSITMDKSALISVTHNFHDSTGTTQVGTVEKSLEEENWWKTNNQISSEDYNLILQELTEEFISRFIEVHGNYVNITSMITSHRKLRKKEAKHVYAQFPILMEYISDEGIQIFYEFVLNDNLMNIPQITIKSTEALLVDAIDFLHYVNIVKSIENINKHINIYIKNMYDKCLKQIDLTLNKIASNYHKLLDQAKQTLLDLLQILKFYSDKAVTDMSSEPHSFDEYYNGVISSLINMVKELKVVTDKIKKHLEDKIMELPLYDLLYKEIEKLKHYPYKDKLWEIIHNQLKEIEKSAPTTDLSDFINALDKYINTMIYDRQDDDQKDLTDLKIKGLFLAKSIIFNFSDYVSYQKTKAVYDALRKLTNISKTILYLISPNSVQLSHDSQIMWFGLSGYIQFYQHFINPSYSLPPYEVQGIVIDYTNIITYNDQPYSFKPNTGSYILAKDYKNNKFSILANYRDNILISLTVLNDNGEMYVLLTEGNITLNGIDIDFPLISNNTKTWKDIYSFGIEIAVGVRVKCTLELDIIEITINGFFFGRVYGLLGFMNQEPTFDFKQPDGKISSNIASFLLMYRQAGDSTPIVVDLVQTDQSPCSSFFSEISTLREVFSTVPPTAYKMICNHMVSSAKSQQDGLDKACLVSKAYVSMAQNNLVTSCSIPDACIFTSVNRQIINAKSSVHVSDHSNIADVMILFEETSEIEHFMNLLNSFIENITKYFNHKKIRDINFIVIGYSGNPTDSEVHIYSANKDNNYSRMLSNIPELSESQTAIDSISSQLIQSYKKVMGQNSKDKAYKLSAEYPFRPNSIKAVLSIANTLYTQSSLDISLYTLNYVTSCYVDQGIKFYLIAPINLKDSSTNGAFGASGTNTIYSLSDPRGRYSKDGFIYNQSLETSLVLKTNGAMYDANFFTEATGDNIKIFIRSLIITIVKNAIKDSNVEKTCSSSLYNGVMPYARCIIETY